MENFTITHIGDYELLQPMPFIFIPAKGKEFTSELNRKKGVFADDFFMAAYPCTQEFWREVILHVQKAPKSPQVIELEEKIGELKIEKNKAVKSRDFEMAASLRDIEKKYQYELELLNGLELNPKPSRFRGDTKPVEKVSWYEVSQFANTLNTLLENGIFGEQNTNNILKSITINGAFMLPSEAQWRYAAQGGVTHENFEFPETDYLPDVGWFEENAKEIMPVGLKQPNALQLYDVCGNVWEWCGNEYDQYPLDGSTGENNGNSKTLRGGGYWDEARYCRVRDRYHDLPDNRSNNIGFRLLFSPSSSTA